jgi:dolichyl-phosphate beta-glucosyltransferase
MKPYLSVIIPCFNEERNLRRKVLDEVENYLKRQKYSYEVIISDDGSTDNSLKLLQGFVKNHSSFSLIKNKHNGKPFALRTGLNKAKGEIILFTDMDQSTPLSEIEKLLPFFKKNFDIVIGSRGKKREGFSLIRVAASGVFRNIRRLLMLKDVVDTQCGFKAFKADVVKKVFSRLAIFRGAKESVGWRVSAYDVEMLFIAKKLGYSLKEVVVNWRDRDISQEKQRKFLKESKEMLTEIIRVKVNDWKGVYG